MQDCVGYSKLAPRRGGAGGAGAGVLVKILYRASTHSLQSESQTCMLSTHFKLQYHDIQSLSGSRAETAVDLRAKQGGGGGG